MIENVYKSTVFQAMVGPLEMVNRALVGFYRQLHFLKLSHHMMHLLIEAQKYSPQSNQWCMNDNINGLYFGLWFWYMAYIMVCIFHL